MRLVRVEMEMRHFGVAKEHIKYLLDTSPNDGSLWGQLGICQAALAAAAPEYDEVAKSLQKAIKLDPQQLEEYARLADVLRRLDKSQEANQWMEKLVAANPKSARAHFLAASYLAAPPGKSKPWDTPSRPWITPSGPWNCAEQTLSFAPDDVDACLLAAQMASDQGLHDQALATLSGPSSWTRSGRSGIPSWPTPNSAPTIARQRSPA